MEEIVVWIVGRWKQAEFSAAIDVVRQRSSTAAFECAVTACSALRAPQLACDPAAILLVQSRPGQVTQEDVERLHAAAPLARLVALVGPWCEGEMRSGKPSPGVIRVPWRCWQSRLLRELGIDGFHRSAGAALPRTSTDSDRLDQSIGRLEVFKERRGTALICTANRQSFDALAGALVTLGVRAIWQPHMHRTAESADLILIDEWDNVPQSMTIPCPPSVLLLHFPRPEDDHRAARLGIAATIAQPLLLTDLAAIVDRYLLTTSSATREAA